MSSPSKAQRLLTEAAGDGRYVNIFNTLPATIMDQLAALIQDTTIPAIPTVGALSTPSASTATLTWTAVTDTDLYQYQWRIGVSNPPTDGASRSTNRLSTSGSATGLTSSTTYYAQVRAVDFRGNASAWSTVATAATPAGLTGLLTDSFTGTNGAAWNSANWTLHLTNGAAATIQNNQGQLAGFTATYTPFGRIELTGVTATADRDLSFTLDRTGYGGEINLNFRHSGEDLTTAGGGSDFAYNGYFFHIEDTKINLQKSVNGAASAVSTDVAVPSRDKRRFRIQWIGTTLQFRSWLTTATEPSTWDWTGADSTFTGAVVPYFDGWNTDSVATVLLFDDFTVNA